MVTFSIPNKCGVFEQHKTIRGAGNGWRIEIHVAQAGKNDWRSSYSLQGHGWGNGSWPSIYDEKFTDYIEAFYNAVQEALRSIENHKGERDYVPIRKWLLSQSQPRLL